MHNCTIKCSLPPKHSKRTDTSLSLVCCLRNVLIPRLGWILSSTVKRRPTVVLDGWHCKTASREVLGRILGNDKNKKEGCCFTV